MKITGQLLHVDCETEDNKPVLRLLLADESGRRIVALDDSFEPYFYAIPEKAEDIKNLADRIAKLEFMDAGRIIKPKRTEIVKKRVGIEEKDVIKIVCALPSDVPKLRENVALIPGIKELREFDILFNRRYMIDRGIEPVDWYEIEGQAVDFDNFPCDIAIKIERIKRLYKSEKAYRFVAFDLETMEENGEFKIIMASVMFDDGAKRVITTADIDTEFVEKVETERELIEKLCRIIAERKPHFVLTYNGDGFDFKVLRERADKMKIKLEFGRNASVRFRRKGRASAAEINGYVHIDLFPFVSVIMAPSLNTEVFSLEAVAQELLGEGKHEMTWEEIEQSWRNQQNLEAIAEYCLRDSELVVMLAEAILPNIFSLASLTYMNPFDVCRSSYSQLVENFAIRKAFKLNYVVPNKPTQEEMDVRRQAEAYEGAIVIQPKPGLHENIAVFDFRSLYPSIIITHNIDPSTINCKCCAKDKAYRVPNKPYYFCRNVRGFIPTILEELITKRMEIKNKLKDIKDEKLRKLLDSMQHAMKTVANAFYGYLAFLSSRFYDRRCAESVAAFGRYYITLIAGMAEKRGFEVIYGDTDSIFLKINSKTKDDILAFLKEVNDSLPGIMELEFQGMYKRGIFVRRKTGEGGAKKRYALIDEEGNITIRGFERVRRDWSKLARETQEKVLYFVLNGEVDKAVNFVRDTIERLKNGKVEKDELGIYTTITRDVSSYEQIGPHVAAARKAIARGMVIRPGETIKYIITRGTGSISDRAELINFADSYDPDYYINNQVLPAALRVLSVLGFTREQILSGTRQVGLARFMKK